LAEASQVFLDVLAALVALHGAGIAHGDVRAGTVTLDDDGRARLGAFGANVKMAGDRPLAAEADDLRNAALLFVRCLGVDTRKPDWTAKVPAAWQQVVRRAVDGPPFPSAAAMRAEAQKASAVQLL
jgi:serine/threonine protein kinase